MYEVVTQIVELFGLNYQPTTFSDLIFWFVLVMCSVCIVCGMIKMMFYLACNSGRLAK